jgi:hypothetical protein
MMKPILDKIQEIGLVVMANSQNLDEEAEIFDIMPALSHSQRNDLMLAIALQNCYPDPEFLLVQLSN